jgi:phage terminase large subunit
MKAEDEDDYNHTYLGEPLENDDASIIKRSWIQAALDAHKVLDVEISGRKRIGFDVADSGADKNATVFTHGFVTLEVDQWKGGEDELLKSASRVHARAVGFDAEIDYDCIGVGAFAGGHFKALNEEKQKQIIYHKFNAGGEVLNKNKRVDPSNPLSQKNGDYYSNLKAQSWGVVGNRFRATYNMVTKGHEVTDELIAISSDCDHLDSLIDELATPRRDFDSRGKMKVESKKDLEKRDIPSPNLADGFIMSNGPRKQQTTGALFGTYGG